MKFDERYHARMGGIVLAGFFGAAIAITGLLASNLMILHRVNAANERTDKIQTVLESDQKLWNAQVDFNRIVAQALTEEELPAELDLDRLAAEYVEAVNAQLVQ